MASDTTAPFLHCLKKPPNARTDKDLSMIYAYLHSLEALSGLREQVLQNLCSVIRYEFHEANSIIYYFGRRSPGCMRRASECLTLEASEMIVIDYPDSTAIKSTISARSVVSTSHTEFMLADGQTYDRTLRRMNSETVVEQISEDLVHGSHYLLGVSDHFQPHGSVEHARQQILQV